MGVTIIYAPRLKKLRGPVDRLLSVTARADPASPDLVPPAVALDAFRAMLARWNMHPARGWCMLTGTAARPRMLTKDHVRRVELLLAIEAAMAGVLTRMDMGVWMLVPNPAPLLAGRSPAEFLTVLGTPGYVALLRQARRWAEL